MQKKEHRISILWVILSCVCFMPSLGLTLLGLRWRQNKKEQMHGGRRLLGLALAFLALFLLFAFVSYQGPEDLLMSGFLFGWGGIAGLVLASSMLAEGKKQEKYRLVVETRRLTSLTAIGEAMNLPRDTVVRDLSRMMADGFFPEAELLEAGNAFHLTPVQPDNRPTQTLRCGGCGAAVMVVQGRVGVCPYCGSPVSYA